MTALKALLESEVPKEDLNAGKAIADDVAELNIPNHGGNAKSRNMRFHVKYDGRGGWSISVSRGYDNGSTGAGGNTFDPRDAERLSDLLWDAKRKNPRLQYSADGDQALWWFE